MESICLHPEDFASYEKGSDAINAIISEFNLFMQKHFSEISKDEDRKLSMRTLENLIVKLIRSSSVNAILQRSEERFDRLKERKRSIPGLKGKSTSPSSQYKYQLLDYLIYGNGTTLNGGIPFITEYLAFSFVSDLILVLELDNSFNYEKLRKNPKEYTDAKKSIHEILRTEYHKSYVPRTLEGFPKGIRLNSALGGPRIIHVKQ